MTSGDATKSLERRLGLLETSAALSLRIGSIIVPARTAEQTAHRYCKQIFAHTDYATYPYSLLGSAICIKFDGITSLLCCKHQIEGIDGDKISIVHRPDNVTISASLFRTLNGHDDLDISDICALHFRLDDYNINNLNSWFFPLEKENSWPNGAIGKFFVIGYPSSLQAAGFSADQIASRALVITAEYDGSSSSPHLHRLVMDNNTGYGSDGLSGSPVFYIGVDSDGFFVGLAGMIQRGSATSSILYFFDIDILKKIMTG